MATVGWMGQTNTINMKPYTIAARRIDMAIAMMQLQSAKELVLDSSMLTLDVNERVICIAYGEEQYEKCNKDLEDAVHVKPSKAIYFNHEV